MKTLFKEHPKLLVLIILGIIFSLISFLYEYVINYNNALLFHTIITIDILLLLIDIYYLSYLVNKKIGKSVVNSAIFSLLYINFFTGGIMYLAEDNASLEVLLKTIKILLYISPNIIIILPIICVICMVLG